MPRPFPFKTLGSVWPAMGVGPRPKVPTEARDFIRHLHSQLTLPWCIAGDFSYLFSHDDKQGRVLHPDWLLSGFKEVISDCSLLEVPLHGYPFTWE